MLGSLQLMGCCRAEVGRMVHLLLRVSSWSLHNKCSETKVCCQGFIFIFFRFRYRLATATFIRTQNVFIYPPTDSQVSQTKHETHRLPSRTTTHKEDHAPCVHDTVLSLCSSMTAAQIDPQYSRQLMSIVTEQRRYHGTSVLENHTQMSFPTHKPHFPAGAKHCWLLVFWTSAWLPIPLD